MRLDAVAGARSLARTAAKTIAESKAATPPRTCAKALVKLCAKDPKEFKAKSKGVGLVVIKDGGSRKMRTSARTAESCTRLGVGSFF